MREKNIKPLLFSGFAKLFAHVGDKFLVTDQTVAISGREKRISTDWINVSAQTLTSDPDFMFEGGLFAPDCH